MNVHCIVEYHVFLENVDHDVKPLGNRGTPLTLRFMGNVNFKKNEKRNDELIAVTHSAKNSHQNNGGDFSSSMEMRIHYT